MRKFFTLILIYIGLVFPNTSYAQSSVDTLFCGDKLIASYNPATDPIATDSFFVWIGNCLSRIRFDFTTADVPDAADIFYLDIDGNITSAGSMPYFGGNCTDDNYFTNPTRYPIQTALQPENCLPGFLEIYGQGVPRQDSVRLRGEVPADFRLQGGIYESARLHLDIPEGVVALLFVVKFNPDETTILEALWDCTPSCCITAQGDSACTGENVQLGTVEKAVSYLWTGPNGFTSTERAPLLENISPADEGWYIVEGSYLFGCSGMDSVYVEVQGSQATLTPDTVGVCLGGSSELVASGGQTYEWLANPEGYVSINNNRVVVAPTVSTIYSVAVSNEYGCVDTISATVIPSDLAFDAFTQNPSCTKEPDGAIEVEILDGIAPFEIRLSGGTWSSGLRLGDLSAGEYVFEVRDAAGCLANGNGTLVDPEQIDVLIGINDPSCKDACDGEIMLMTSGGTGPFNFMANNQQVDSISSGYCEGTYPLEVIDANGCTWSTAFTIEEPEAFRIDLGKDKKVREGKSLDLKIEANATVDSVVWEGICEQNCDTQILFTPDSSMTITARAWTASGCEATASMNVQVKKKAECGNGLYFPSAFTPNGDGINEYFTLYADSESSDVEEIQRLTIFNKWGRMVFDKSQLTPGNDKAGWDGTSKGNLQKEGVYTWVATILNEDNLTYSCSGTIILLK